MSINIFDKHLLSHGDKTADFNEITMALASPEKMRSWSYGEVRLPETINYRTFKPEPGGLFCAKIFGPVKDYECICGKYKRMKYRNIICEKCNVEVTVERVRRERMGHINLACPVAHILFFKSLPSRIGLMVDLTMRDIERILYFEAYVVLDPKRIKEIERGKLLNVETYQNLIREYGEGSFDAGMGAEGLRDFLKEINLDDEVEFLREELLRSSSATKTKKLLKRLKLMENFRAAGLRPEWMILETLPVLPPNLRPLVQLDGVRFTTSDLNDLYRRVINRNNRLRKLIELAAPEIIVNNEKRMLQEAVDSLLDNGRRGKPAVGANKRPLKSLADIVKGKTGRFRQNLLGKRVDFSARSVIVVGPSLKLHQCGLPKHMALSLFRPFVFNELTRRGLASNIKQARQRVEEPDAEVWDVLEKVIYQHPILLNRAPTLHRLGIQAFEPVLIEGKAIQLHPLVCVAFNADFDGDQMAVHVPLSLEAQAEARVLMLASNNILSPANGEPIILPTQDVVLGLYYATRECLGAHGEGMCFVDLNEMSTALAEGAVHLQAGVSVLLPKSRVLGQVDEVASDEEDSEEEKVLVKTTAGRALILPFLPAQMPFERVNKILKKKDLSGLVSEIFRNCGLRETVFFCDRLMRFGFDQATRAGISICMEDMVIPDQKVEIIGRADKEMRTAQRQYRDGLLTLDERYNKSVDLWDKAGEDISRIMMEELSRETVVLENGEEKNQESFNSLYMMADSGARGSQTQIKQLAGMRGLMTKPDGRIMETAITANFREGLSVLQYFLSTHGARKGLADTALKTANSGYLTRRLVDVSQDVVVRIDDCGADEGITLRAILMGGETVVPLSKRIFGRFLAIDLLHPQTNQVLYPAGTFIDEEQSAHIAEIGVDEVVVRSPVKCKLSHGLCIKCYGRDLARGGIVQLGEAVGVIAAQSIGEPGTQLTMRTFHIGGAASRSAVSHRVESKYDGELRVSARYVTNSRGELVIVSRGGEMSVHDNDNRERERYRLQYGDVLTCKDGAKIKAGKIISTRDPLVRPLITEYSGKVVIDGLEEGVNARRQTDDITGVDYWVIIEDKRSGRKSQPVQIKFLGDDDEPVKVAGTDTEVSISLRPDTTLEVASGQVVNVGDRVATMPQEASKSRDITGGLPRVAELFEAREPKEPSMLAAITGRVSLLGTQRTKRILAIIDDEADKQVVEIVKGWKVGIKSGSSVKVGDVLAENAEKDVRIAEFEGLLEVREGKKRGDKTLIVSSAHFHTVPKDRNILVQDGMQVKHGEEIVEGDVNPHEILAKRGIEALTAHIVDEVQSVYRLQGVTIDDKHIEVIVHQMLRCVVVEDAGESRYLIGDQLVMSQVDAERERLAKEGKAPLRYRNILLGITKASLATDSFISAASFQETTRVLTEAAVSGRRDKLRGLKENVTVGRLIPAGTGFAHYNSHSDDEYDVESPERVALEALTNISEPPATPEGTAEGG